MISSVIRRDSTKPLNFARIAPSLYSRKTLHNLEVRKILD